MIITKIIIAAFLLIPSITTLAQKQNTISFIHITDIHICNLTSYHKVIGEKRQHFGNGAEPFISFIRSAPGKTGADFITITGDLIDYYEATTSFGKMLDTEVEQFVGHLENCDVPVYLTLGNHDIASYRMTSETSYSSYQYNAGRARAAWIRNAPCFRNGTYYSRTFKVDTTEYRLIFLDNSYYAPRRITGNPDFDMDPYQLYWLDNEMKASESDIEIIFMHMPLININPDDMAPSRNKYYLNLDDTLPIKHELVIPDTNIICLRNILRQNSSAKLLLTGHQHSSLIHEVKFTNDYSLTHLMTGAFGYHPDNWRIIHLTGNSILISFPGDSRIQYRIPLKVN